MTTNVVLYNGPPANVIITTELVEFDQSAGNLLAVIDKVAGWLEGGSELLKTAGGLTDIDVLRGYGREVGTVADTYKRIETSSIFQQIVAVFNSPDDPYPAGILNLDWRSTPKKVPTRSDDPHSLVWTEFITVRGTDDGGDLGVYVFYFNVNVTDISTPFSKMSSPYKPHIRSTSPPSSDPSRKRIGSDEPSHESLIELSPSPSNSTMADRFPSLDDFGAGQTSPRDPTADTDSDFLTRERAALGDDAAQFSGAGDNATTVEDGGEEDLLGGDGAYQDGGGGGGNEMMDEFESSFPAVDTRNEAMAPGGTMTGSSTLPFQSGVGAPQPSYGAPSTEGQEPEPIRAWRTARTSTLTSRASLAADKKASTIAQAQTYIDDFYESYNRKKEKSIAKTRKEAEAFLAGREDTSAGGTSWERIARLVDLSAKGAGAGAGGKERFREVLVGLRGDEGAPGAGGY